MPHPLDPAVSDLIRTVAREVVMPHFRALAPSQISEKTPGDYVTIADKQSEERLTAGLAAIYPQARIIGEEAVAADPALLDNLGSGLAWIVDPIDGTGNYAAGRSPFAIMVALLSDGETQAGWVFDPVKDRMCHASIGGGAFVNGAPIRTADHGRDPPHAALPFKFLAPEVRADIEARAAGRLTSVPMPYCAGEEYARMVAGETDIALFGRMLPWDHAPGSLFLSEAGGRIAHYDGTPYRPGLGGRGLIAAATPELWERARAILVD